MIIVPKHRDLFPDFCRQMIETKDVDPSYYTIKGVIEERKYSEADAFRYFVTYAGFYWFKSADDFFKDPKLDCTKLTYGTARRGFRGSDKVRTFIGACVALRPFILSERHKGEMGWKSIYKSLLSVPGCGPWGAFNITDMTKVILGRDITSPDFGQLSSGNTTGPIAGLSLITGIDVSKIFNNDRLQRQIYEEASTRVKFSGMEEMESCLCNYMSLFKEKYYVGRDIDRQIPALAGVPEEFFTARKRYFPKALLGEEKGWYGVRKELLGTHEFGKVWTEEVKIRKEEKLIL